MTNLEVYLKPTKKYTTQSPKVYLSDICDVFVTGEDNPNILKKIQDICLVSRMPTSQFTTVSSLDMFKAVKKLYPSATLTNLGEDVTLIATADPEDTAVRKYLKVGFITVILFIGCATAIITFHVDTQLNRIMNTYAHMLGIDHSANSVQWFMEVPYALGLAVGIIVFFNHIFGKKFTKDPTPLEVEMSTYEADVVDALIDNCPKEN